MLGDLTAVFGFILVPILYQSVMHLSCKSNFHTDFIPALFPILFPSYPVLSKGEVDEKPHPLYHPPRGRALHGAITRLPHTANHFNYWT